MSATNGHWLSHAGRSSRLAGYLLCLVAVPGCSLLLDFSEPFCPTGPSLGGTWEGDGVQLVIGHEIVPFICEEEGGSPPPGKSLVFVHGFNEGPDALWELIALSGEVVEPGMAEASGRLWRRRNSSLSQVANVEAKLVRFGTTMTLSLDFTAGGIVRDEDFDLILLTD